MLALADRFAHAGPQKRSLIFIAFTGEEEGLIGSQHFVSNCPVPTSKIVSMLNLDMVGRVSGESVLIGGEGTTAAFPKIVEDADRGLPLKLSEFGKGGIGPSDHTSFALKRIPVLFFFSGLHLDYHRPTDTADKINFNGINEVIDLGQRVVTAMTTMPRAAYNGSYDAGGMMQMVGSATSPQSGSTHGGRASLGAIPDYAQGEDAKDGMRIGGIMPGSPAEKSGLRQGDVVTRFDDRAIGNMMDYTEALGKAKPGQAVKLQLLRDKSSLTIEVTPAARKD
jgi:aminopeptidase YwaD